MEQFLKKHHHWVVLIILTFFITVSVLNAKNDSATFDEIAHIPAGYTYVTEHDMRLNPEHPPLLKDLFGLPLAFLDLKFDTSKPFWTGAGLNRAWDDAQWASGHHLLYEARNDTDQIIFWARISTIILSVILGLFLFKWGKEFAGTLGGLFVLTLYAFSPNILGHNHYATTDIGIATFITFAFYYFVRFIKNPTWKNAAIGGLFLGLVNLVKFSSLMAYPVLGLVLIAYPLIKKISHDENEDGDKMARLKIFLSYLSKGCAAFAISMLVVWALYFVNTYDMPHWVIEKQINFSFPESDSNPANQITRSGLTFLNSSTVLKPYAEYMLGVAMVFKRVAGGNGAYFLGNVSADASPLYFPLVFTLKETLPFLLLIAFSIVFTLTRALGNIERSIETKTIGKHFKHFLQTGVMQYTLLGFVILYSYLSITGNLNIGLRHLFPIIPLLYLLVTKKVFDCLRGRHAMTKHQMHIILAVLLVWTISIPIMNYPHYVSYFNETVGGSKNGYKYVTDSNNDWGQDLKRLKTYLDQNPQIDKIHVDYFGGGNPKMVLGEKYIQWWDSMRPIKSGWYAISANSLQTSRYNKGKNSDSNYSWTQRYAPVTIIGNSILIYYVPVQQAN